MATVIGVQLQLEIYPLAASTFISKNKLHGRDVNYSRAGNCGFIGRVCSSRYGRRGLLFLVYTVACIEIKKKIERVEGLNGFHC